MVYLYFNEVNDYKEAFDTKIRLFKVQLFDPDYLQ